MSTDAQVSGWRRFLERNSFLRHYLWKYRTYVALGIFSLLVVDLLEVIPPVLLKKAIDVVTAHHAIVDLSKIQQATHQLALLAGLYVGIAVLQGIGRYGWRMFLIRSSLFSSRDLRQRYANHLFGLSASFFDKRRIGDLMSLATNDVEAVRMAMGAGLLTLVDALFFLITLPTAMFLLSPRLTLLAMVPMLFVPWYAFVTQKKMHDRFQEVQHAFGDLAAMVQENLNGVRVIKAFGREDARIRKFRDAGLGFIRLNMRLSRVQSTFGPVLDFSMSFGLVLLLFVGGRGVIEETVTLGTFVAFQRYIQQLIWPMVAVGHAMVHYQKAIASSERLKEVFVTNTDVPEPETWTPEKHSILEKTPTLEKAPTHSKIHSPRGKTHGEVEFRNLSFRFPGTDVDVLSNLSLTIEPGERVAFVGTIGAGKSALLSLLPRLYPVSRGMLFVDGQDVNDWGLQDLRRQIGYVSQEVFLFSESVLENVAFGMHEWVEQSGQMAGQISPIEEATRLASVHEEVLGLFEGYQTRLGERGINLSGGQKQRITIARAIAKQPSILVLDDALSSVDVQTEEQILKSLRERSGRNTELIAAHRISTVQDADRIVVLSQGKVQQIGTHRKLIAEREGLYRKFYDEQRLKEDLENYVERLDRAGGPSE